MSCMCVCVCVLVGVQVLMDERGGGVPVCGGCAIECMVDARMRERERMMETLGELRENEGKDECCRELCQFCDLARENV